MYTYIYTYICILWVLEMVLKNICILEILFVYSLPFRGFCQCVATALVLSKDNGVWLLNCKQFLMNIAVLS